MTQRNLRGAYMNFTHDRPADWEWLAKWQPNVIRYMAPGSHTDPTSVAVARVKRLHETCPEATILLRVWDVDDRNFEAHDAMMADPRGEAERQVNWWASVFDRMVAAGIPRERLMAGLNNETGPEKDAALYIYTERALELGTQRAIRLGVYVFSVGRPALAGEAEYDIPAFERLSPAIIANKGARLLHQYMQPEGMYAVWVDDQGNERKDWTYLMGRDLRWTVDVPTIFAEWGLDGLLYNRYPDPKYGNSGWRNFKGDWPPNRYADEYVECVRQANDNVIGICPFISDFADHKWQSFDLIDAYGEFIARKDLCVKEVAPTKPPIDTHLPSISTGTPKSAYVAVKAGANLRKAPRIDGELITSVPYAEQIQVYPDDAGLGWSLVEYQGNSGYMFSSLFTFVPPVSNPGPTEPVTPTGDDWGRVWPITLNIEGGLSTDRSDPGNYRPDGTFVGTKFGISALAHPTLDIVNLTKEQALEIYRRDYWQGSGADKLPWPLNLLHFDAYVQNEAAAKKFLAASGGNPGRYMAERIDWYTRIDNWETQGRGWMRRCATMLREASK